MNAHPFQEQIERERKKIALLEDKIKECKARIDALLSVNSDDELDRLLEKELVETPKKIVVVSTHPGSVSEPSKKRHKRIPDNWVAIINFLGEEGKTFQEVETFLKSSGLGMSSGAARTGLMNYRKEFGFVENPRKGFYKATPEGLLEAAKSQKEEGTA